MLKIYFKIIMALLCLAFTTPTYAYDINKLYSLYNENKFGEAYNLIIAEDIQPVDKALIQLYTYENFKKEYKIEADEIALKAYIDNVKALLDNSFPNMDRSSTSQAILYAEAYNKLANFYSFATLNEPETYIAILNKIQYKIIPLLKYDGVEKYKYTSTLAKKYSVLPLMLTEYAATSIENVPDTLKIQMSNYASIVDEIPIISHDKDGNLIESPYQSKIVTHNFMIAVYYDVVKYYLDNDIMTRHDTLYFKHMIVTLFVKSKVLEIEALISGAESKPWDISYTWVAPALVWTKGMKYTQNNLINDLTYTGENNYLKPSGLKFIAYNQIIADIQKKHGAETANKFKEHYKLDSVTPKDLMQ